MRHYLLSALTLLAASSTFAPVAEAFESKVLLQAEGVEALSQASAFDKSSDHEDLSQYTESRSFRPYRRHHRHHNNRRHDNPQWSHHRP